MRQLQMLNEARGLDIVRVRQDEFLVLRRRGDLLAELCARRLRSMSAMAIALRSAPPKARP